MTRASVTGDSVTTTAWRQVSGLQEIRGPRIRSQWSTAVEAGGTKLNLGTDVDVAVYREIVTRITQGTGLNYGKVYGSVLWNPGDPSHTGQEAVTSPDGNSLLGYNLTGNWAYFAHFYRLDVVPGSTTCLLYTSPSPRD